MDTRFIERIRHETTKSAFLTPWVLGECAKMTIAEIEMTFGDLAADFWARVRRGAITLLKEG